MRGEIRFRREAERAFEFLVEEFGFRTVEATDTLVRFETDNVFVNVYHGRRSYELRFEIGLLSSDSKYYPEEVVALHGLTTPVYFQASTRERVAEFLPQLAGILRCNGRPLLEGDRSEFERLQSVRLRQAERDEQRQLLTTARERAAAAWKRRDYQAVIDALGCIDHHLTRSEQMKLRTR